MYVTTVGHHLVCHHFVSFATSQTELFGKPFAQISQVWFTSWAAKGWLPGSWFICPSMVATPIVFPYWPYWKCSHWWIFIGDRWAGCTFAGTENPADMTHRKIIEASSSMLFSFTGSGCPCQKLPSSCWFTASSIHVGWLPFTGHWPTWLNSGFCPTYNGRKPHTTGWIIGDVINC